MFDQAARLRALVTTSQKKSAALTRVIAVSSGKGGVGKSNLTLNLALGLCSINKKVIIIDADVGFANIDVLMGISSKSNLQDVLERRSTIWQILQEGPNGIQFIAGGSGLSNLLSHGEEELKHLISQLEELQGYADFILIDTGAGLDDQTLRFILSADELIVVTTPEPTSITDAYALIKLVVHQELRSPIRLLVNRATSKAEGDETAAKLKLVANQFLKIDLEFLGSIPEDSHVSKAVKMQQPFYLHFPDSEVSRSINELTTKLLGEPQESLKETGIKSFMNRLLKLFKS